MVKLAVENGKFIIKDGKIAIVQDGQSGCGCCCKECCWKVQSLTGCPGPEVDADLESNSFTFRFMDSTNCRDIGDPQNCKPNPNKETDTTDKTTCNQLQYIILTNEWTISETTNVTVDLSGTAETAAPDKDYIDITLTPLNGQPIVGDGGDPRFRTANTYHARIASDDGDLGSSEDGCNMNDISNSWTFELAPGCWSVRIYSCTRDAFSHIGMTNSVQFSFDTDPPQNCKDHLCTNVTCGGIINGGPGGGGGTGGTGAGGVRNESNPRNGEDYGFALIDQPITNCTVENWEEEGPPPSSVSDCVKDCENSPENPCKRIEYYCCVDGICNRFSKKLCGTQSSDEKSGVDGEADIGGSFCSADGPYYCTLRQCTDSEECKVKYCCDAKDETCRPCNKVEDSADEKNGVDGNGFDTIEDCRQICEAGAKYDCDTGINGESAQCVKAKDPDNAAYENIDACLEDCEEDKGNRYTCTDGGECLRNAFGEYDNEQMCLDDCGGEGGRKWYCCYTEQTKSGPTECREGNIDQNGKFQPACEHGVASGPHSALACSIACGSHSCEYRCDGSTICKKSPLGTYNTLNKCLSRCRAVSGPKPKCSMQEGVAAPVDIDNDPDNEGLFVEWRRYAIDPFQRSICFSYSTNGKPIRVQFLRPKYDANCNILSLISMGYSSWFTEEDCECEGSKKAPGTRENKRKGSWRFTKPRGYTEFFIRIFSCDPESYEIKVKCDECDTVDDKEVFGACCSYDKDTGDFLGCDEDIAKKECEEPADNNKIGKFLGPCSKCEDEDGNDNCIAKLGACCYPEGDDIGNCGDRRTKARCEPRGEYQGDDTWCDTPENRANLQIPRDKLVLCPGLGACCILKWDDITITDCTVVDYIEANGQKLTKSTATVSCEDAGECEPIEVNVVNKTIKCIENNEQNRNILGNKIPVVNVLTNITLPENNCNNQNVAKVETKVPMLALEAYPESYEPLFDIKTAQVNLNGVKFAQIGLLNGGKLGDVVIIKDGDTITGVSYASGYICKQTHKQDCDKEEGSFTNEQLCCKTFAANGKDCEEEWCDEEAAIQSFQSYAVSETNNDTISMSVEKTASSGPGTELKKLLSKIGINASPSCSCNSRARIMDQWGPEKCEQEIETILGWLKEEASKRKLPFVDMAGYILIKRAIYNARKNNK